MYLESFVDARILELSAMWKMGSEWLRKVEKKPIMHLARSENCADASVVAFVDVEGLADTVIAAAAVILAVVAGDAAGASAH